MANTLIHETRRLRFPLDTLVDALIELEDKQGHWVARATVVGASIDPGEGESCVVLSVHRPDTDKVSERRYSLPVVAAAIVNYCVTMRVPIPRNSTKSIQVLEDGIALLLENTVLLQSRHEELSTLPAGSMRPPATPAAVEVIAAAPVPDTGHPETRPPPEPTPPDSA